MNRPIRTRYAPSPTGYQHIGGIRTALLCYLFTRKRNGTFILRIEDTDRSRYLAEAEDYIIESLKWCGLECDEGVHVGGDYGPYRQSDRKAIYAQYVQQLLDNGKAYYAFDTTEELVAMRENFKTKENPSPKYDHLTRMQMKNSLTLSEAEVKSLLDNNTPYTVRIRIPDNQDIIFNDLVRGKITFHSSQLDDKVLMKADGMPTYHLANVVDDHLMEISHVIRGEEWLSSTPLHVVLYNAFGWTDTMPAFAHLPLILKPVGKGKLSKRDGDKFGFPVFPLGWEGQAGYRELGFLPEAFLNFLAFLGWNPGTEQEIFSLSELIEAFSVDRITKAGARFNFDKAKWFNAQYIKALDDDTFSDLILKDIPEAYQDVDPAYIKAAALMMKERINLLSEFWDTGFYFFKRPAEYERKVIKKKWKNDLPEKIAVLRNRLASASDFSATVIETTVKDFMKEFGLGFGDVLPVFRIMLAGTKAGPPVFEMAALLGQEEVIARMDAGAENF